MSMLSPTPPTVKPDAYAKKAIVTRRRNNRIDARLTAQFAERRQAFQAKLDAILAANTERKITVDSELTWEQEQDINDYEAWVLEHVWEAHNQRRYEADMLACEQEDEIDALPYDSPDMVTPQYLGAMDYQEGMDCDPALYYVKVTDCEAYIVGYRDAKGELEMTAEYADYLEDVEWMRTGC